MMFVYYGQNQSVTLVLPTFFSNGPAILNFDPSSGTATLTRTYATQL